MPSEVIGEPQRDYAIEVETDVPPNEPLVRRMRPYLKRLRSSLGTILGQFMVGLIAVFAWEAAVRVELVNPLTVGQPTRIIEFLSEALLTGEFWGHVRVTLESVLWALLIGTVSGVVSGAILARWRTIARYANPYIGFLNAIPRIALAPLFLLWFGIGIWSKVALGVSLVYFIMLVNTKAGLESVDKDLIDVARLTGAKDRQILSKVTLPAAAASVFAGFRLAVTYALLGVVAGEIIAAQAGLGQRLSFYANTFQVNRVMGILVFFGFMAMVITAIVGISEKRILRWRDL